MDPTLNLQKAATPVIEKLNGWGLSAVKMLPNLVVAVIVLVFSVLLAFVVGRVVHRMVKRISPYGHVARLVAGMSRLTVIAVGIILALSAMSLDRAVASVLAGVGIVSIAIGFASKDIAADYMAGFLIHFTHPFRTGHIIQVGNFFGYVESIEMRATKCHTQQGQKVIIPNRKIIEGEIINYSISGVRRVDITVSVSYSVDLEVLEELVIDAVESLELRNSERPVELFYEGFNGTAITFMVRFWTEPEQTIFLKARSEAIKAIDQLFKAHGITLPSQNVSLDFRDNGRTEFAGAVGGSEIIALSPSGEESRERERKPGRIKSSQFHKLGKMAASSLPLRR